MPSVTSPAQDESSSGASHDALTPDLDSRPPLPRRLRSAGWRAALPIDLAIVLGGALLAWIQVQTGFANYDTLYSLLWGSDIAAGRMPDYGVPVAPTPHPLATLVGFFVSPLGAVTAENVVVVIAFGALGCLGLITYRLGALWFGRAAGALAAAIILTRIPVLSFGVRAYVDIPYVVFVLTAVWLHVRGRSAFAVLGLLLLAGLLRPEAWLFSFAYFVYLFVRGERRVGRLVLLAAVGAGATILWSLSDLVITGNALHSLIGTQANAEVLQRKTGLVNVALLAPRRIGEILREPVLYGCVVGGVLAWFLMRARAVIAVIVGLVAFAGFCVLAVAGLPILGRYLLLIATLLTIFCGAGAFGWVKLARENPWRRRWQIVGLTVLLALVVFTPRQIQRVDQLRASFITQRQIRDDLHKLTTSSAFRRACGQVAVPNHRPVPLLALWSDLPAKDIVSAQQVPIGRGYFFAPATRSVEDNFTLDPHDPKRLTATVPVGFREVLRNRFWVLYSNCS